MTEQPQGQQWGGVPATRFHVMAKPVGAACNLRCRTCYYLHKPELLKNSRAPGEPEAPPSRMSDATLEAYVRQNISGQNYGDIVFSWQGGEPTLLGLDFFKKVVDLQRRGCPPQKKIHNDLQTNGTLITDEWCAFLAENNFLVGLSVDGPRDIHDAWRPDAAARGTLAATQEAAARMRKHGVPFNTLTCVHAGNAKRPLDVYRFLRREIGSTRLQFIPIVEPRTFETVAPGTTPENMPVIGSPQARPGSPDSIVTDWSVDPDDWGAFLCKVFDEWHGRDRGKAFVYYFESAVAQWMGLPASMCTMAPICGKALAVEADGSVYSCDHFVYPEYRLGNIHERELKDLVFSPRQERFGLDKMDRLPQVCRKCRWRFACNGECPKNRLLKFPDGEPGLNYLCSGWKRYFQHIDSRVTALAQAVPPMSQAAYFRGDMR